MSLEGYAESVNNMNVLRGKISSLSPYALDKTLSVEGASADAKAVGDALENKVSYSDIVNDLVTLDTDKPLSAAQGVALKSFINELIGTSEVMGEGIANAQSTADNAQTAAFNAQATADTAATTAEEAQFAATAAQEAAEEAKESVKDIAASTLSVTTESIGAEKKRLQFTDAPCYIASFADDTTYANFPYRGAIDLNGVSADMTPEVVFGIADAMSGNYAPVAACYNGGVFIYAAEKPSNDFTIPTIICWKAVG